MPETTDPNHRNPYLTDPNGREHSIQHIPFIIGRAVECDVVISSMSVSREHAHIRNEDRHWFISDCGSTNGTYLNGERLNNTETLIDGDSIKIGDVNFIFHDPETTIRETPFPELEVDTSSGSVRVNRKEILLSAKEYMLLKYLHQHKGKVCSKDEISQAVWPEYEIGNIFDYQIENLMRRLRTRVETDPSQPQLLLTVRGLGYKLVGR